MSVTTLSSDFLNELFKLSLRKRDIFTLAKQHVKYTFLPSQHYKEIWQAMIHYNEASDKLMTVGLLSEQFKSNKNVIEVIGQIKQAQTPDTKDVISQLEVYIKNKIFIEAYEDLSELFNKNKKDQAFVMMGEVAEKLKEFKIIQKSEGSRVFDQFFQRHQDRIDEQHKSKDSTARQKIPTGIAPFDKVTNGGIDRGDTLLLLADSGVGKSKGLKHIGLSAARRGYRVIHIQAEGTLKEAQDAYDAAIAGVGIDDIEVGNLSSTKVTKVHNTLNTLLSQGGEIHIKAFEQFDRGTIRDVHSFCQSIIDQYGQIDLVVLDYLDEMDPGDGKRYFSNQDGVRLSKRASAKKFKNICVEYNVAGATATQASDIKDKDKEDPEYHLKRGDTSENKKLLQPFSYLITLNRTTSEEENGVMRLYVDKARKYKIPNRSIPISTSFHVERFYDHKRTIELFGLYE